MGGSIGRLDVTCREDRERSLAMNLHETSVPSARKDRLS